MTTCAASLVIVFTVGCGPDPRPSTVGPGGTSCTPGAAVCSGDLSHACADDGMSYVDVLCDPVQGMTCDAASGQCRGACSPQALGNSYVGCDYYPTVTGNSVSPFFDFAIAIASSTETAATVTVEGGALPAPQVVTLAAGSVVVQPLPWVVPLKLCDSAGSNACIADGVMLHHAALVPGGAYHVRSTAPVTIYQFNSLEYVKAGYSSYTNDASLLLPTNVWRTRYLAASWPTSAIAVNPSELAVTALRDGTQVTITAKAATPPDGGAPGFAAGTPQTVTLNAGGVLEIAAAAGDLTGSQVDSDQPVQVVAGHYCTNIPATVGACDHLEESMLPVDALGTRYLINAPAVTTLPAGKVEIVRVIATADDTHLTYEPPVTGAPTTIAHAGDFADVPSTALSYRLTADQKVLVAQYMEGQDAGGNTGDPAMALAVPEEQFRTSYVFHAPPSYDTNYVDVTAPAGATVRLDGVPVAFTPIGATGFGLGRVEGLSTGPTHDGHHRIEGDHPFGITVYGYGQFTSYWYPGGLDVNQIIE